MNQATTSRVDFNTRCDNSSRLHIVLVPVGNVEQEFLDKVPHELGKVPLPNSNQLSAKFVLQSQPLLTDWCDVQYYRKPVGLLCVTQVDSSSNLAGILPQYEKIKRRMESSVIDSRCIVFSNASLVLPPDCIRPDIMVIQYTGDVSSIHCEELTALIGEFTQALYSVIVRNTIEMSAEKYSPQLLYSPYERSKSGLDDGKLGRKRVQARHKKHLGDLFLIIGKPERANEAYEDAIRNLNAIGDSLWCGAAYEGQCCAIARIIQLEEAECITILGGARRHSSKESLNSASSETEMNAENLVRLFRLAINYMEKMREASLVLLECTFKFIRLMIDLDCKREACVILNGEIYYSYEDLMPVERLQFFCTIALLYKEMGMNRKYSYFLRRAALESTQEKMLAKAYTMSSALLCNVIEMYGVIPGNQNAFGWPKLQKSVLDDLISTSDKLGSSDSVVRYGMCLLQNFYYHLDENDQLRILNLIFKNNTRLGEQTLDAPNIPVCKKVIIKPLAKSLEPQENKQSDSIFIFNPNARKNNDYTDVHWVSSEFGEVLVKLENPLLHSLQLFDIRCIIEGGTAECYPGNITIYPKQTVEIMLSIRPTSPGKLQLTGIKLQLCGVPCHFPLTVPDMIVVSKPLPLLSLKSELPSTLSLYEGEETTLSCYVVNNSDYPIHHLDIIDTSSGSNGVFSFNQLALPLLPGAQAEFRIGVNTHVGYARRSQCFDTSRGKQRRGTIYENSSEFDEEPSPVVRKARKVKVRNVFVEESFSVSFRYYDEGKEYFRQMELQFQCQINLLYQLAGYSIGQHLTDSSKCRLYLSLASLCPQRMEMVIAGSSCLVDPGEVLVTNTDIERMEGYDNQMSCHHRVTFSDLLDPSCKIVPWVIGDRRGSLDIMESVTQYTDLTLAFKEKLVISCVVSGCETLADGKFSTPLGAPITLTVTVENVSNQPLSSLLLYGRTHQEGSAAFNKLCDVPLIGTRDKYVDTLSPQQKISYTFALLPITGGSFKVEVGACVLPPQTENTAYTIQYSNKDLLAELVSEEETQLESPVIPRKIIVQYLNDGLPPPKYVDSWKMRPSLVFEVLKS